MSLVAPRLASSLCFLGTSTPRMAISYLSSLFNPLTIHIPSPHPASDDYLALPLTENRETSRQVLLHLFTSETTCYTHRVPFFSASPPGTRGFAQLLSKVSPSVLWIHLISQLTNTSSSRHHQSLLCTSIIPISVQPVYQDFLSLKKTLSWSHNLSSYPPHLSFFPFQHLLLVLPGVNVHSGFVALQKESEVAVSSTGWSPVVWVHPTLQ